MPELDKNNRNYVFLSIFYIPHYDLPVLRILDARDVDDMNFFRYHREASLNSHRVFYDNVDLFNPLLKAVFIKKIIRLLFLFFFGIFELLFFLIP